MTVHSERLTRYQLRSDIFFSLFNPNTDQVKFSSGQRTTAEKG